jgi:hypothetical protein
VVGSRVGLTEEAKKEILSGISAHKKSKRKPAF